MDNTALVNMDETTKIKKSYELTKDFRILPNADCIKDLIEADTESIADKIKERLFNEVEDNRGSAYIKYEISHVHRSAITQKLHTWAKLHGYKCKVDGDTISIKLKGIKHSRYPVCKHCGKMDKTIRRFIIGLCGTILLGGSSIILSCHWNSFGWSTSAVVVGFVASSIWICIAAEWDN